MTPFPCDVERADGKTTVWLAVGLHVAAECGGYMFCWAANPWLESDAAETRGEKTYCAQRKTRTASRPWKKDVVGAKVQLLTVNVAAEGDNQAALVTAEQFAHFSTTSFVFSSTAHQSCFQYLLLRCHFLIVVLILGGSKPTLGVHCRVASVPVHPRHRY